MAQQQSTQQVDPQLAAPSEEQLRDYKLGMEWATARFHELVHMQGVHAYVELIHILKITSCRLISDLMDADEDKVLQSIWRTDGHHFKTGFTVHTRASSSRTYSPEFSTEEFDNGTNKLICELHLEASEVCAKMAKIHCYIAILKTKVSPQNFFQIVLSVGLPLTTISIVDPASQEANVDNLHVHDHMTDPNILHGSKATLLLGALVRFHMQNILLTTQGTYRMAACEKEFKLGCTKFERVISGIRRPGSHEYGKKKKFDADELPTGTVKPKTKKQNPVDKGQAGLVLPGAACKYCGKLCFNEETLSIHINNKHTDRQSVFQCAFCCIKTNDFRLHIKNLEEHSKDMYKCYACSE